MILAVMGLSLAGWTVYCEPARVTVATPLESPDCHRVTEEILSVGARLGAAAAQGRAARRSGLIDALFNGEVNGRHLTDEEISGILPLLICGGFDTTTALMSHSLEWLFGYGACGV